VKNIQMPKFKEISENDTIGKALSLFQTSHDVIIVNNQKNEYTGILVERSILRTDLDPGKSKVKSFIIKAPKIKHNTEITECARLMGENNILYLPVFDKGRVTGVVSYIDVLKSEALLKFSKQPVKNIMAKNVPVAATDDNISVVYNKFKKSDLFSIPVVDNDNFIGLVNLHETIHTILQHKEKPDFGTKLGEKKHLLKLPIKNIMVQPTISLLDNVTIEDVVENITQNELECITILDADSNLQAIITVKDILRLISAEKEVFLPPKIQINSHLEELNRSSVEAAIISFANKYISILSQSEFEIYMREHKEKQKHQKLIYTRISVHAHHDSFSSTAEGFGVDHSLKEALDKLERQVKKKKTTRKHGGRK
jgi:acetoin utilization protein AcuB